MNSLLEGIIEKAEGALKEEHIQEIREQTLLNGFFARMFLEFMSPSQFLELVQAGFHSFR